jgi:hypothetical protein
MAATRPPRQRRRARRGSLERPINARMYRGTWLLVGLPLLIASFSVSRPEPLPEPPLPPTFDAGAAASLTRDLARSYPDRSPASAGAAGAADWVAQRFEEHGFETSRQPFEATIPGLGTRRLQNVIAVAPASRSRQTIVVMAHRDATPLGPGVNDNASGTAALVELARAYGGLPAPGAVPQTVVPARRIVFLSTDGGAYGGLGAAHFAAGYAERDQIVAVVNLDGIASRGRPRMQLAGDTPRSPPGELVATAAARVLDYTQQRPSRASALRQLLDLAFPFSLYEQGPFVGRGIPAITLTTQGDRPEPAFEDVERTLSSERLAEIGRAAQSLLASLDAGLELTRETSSTVYVGTRAVRGWAVELVLVSALLPFFAAAVDLFARCRRRHIPLAPAFRSYRSRIAFWIWAGALFALFALVGAWPKGDARPPSPETEAVRTWPLAALAVFGALALVGWFVARDRLLPRRHVAREEELAGYTASLLVLAVLALLVVATNPFALVFLLPSLHAWLWLPHLRARRPALRLTILALGFAGPGVLVVSFATRFELGFDAPWYLAQLAALGYVPASAAVIALAWVAAAAQLAALSVHRYAPYPPAAERPPRGPLREVVRRIVLATRRRRAAPAAARAAEGG